MSEAKAITVGELKKQLEGVPDKFPVILSSDAEGNSFHPLGEVSLGGKYNTEDCQVEGEVGDPAESLVLTPLD